MLLRRMRAPPLMQGICASSTPEPKQAAPRSNASGRASDASAGHAAAASSRNPGSSDPPPTAAEASRRRQERAAAAEARVKASANRGKSGNGASSKGGSSLYGSLGDGEQTSPKRAPSQWEIENQDALGATVFRTNEKA